MKTTLNIEPKPQTRPRFSKFGTYEDPRMKAWRRRCSQLIEQEYDGQFFDGPISVDVTFYMKAPLSVSKSPRQKLELKHGIHSRNLWMKGFGMRKSRTLIIWSNRSLIAFQKLDITRLIRRVSSGWMTVSFAI